MRDKSLRVVLTVSGTFAKLQQKMLMMHLTTEMKNASIIMQKRSLQNSNY